MALSSPQPEPLFTSRCFTVQQRRLLRGRARLFADTIEVAGWLGFKRYQRTILLQDIDETPRIERNSPKRPGELILPLASGEVLHLGLEGTMLWKLELDTYGSYTVNDGRGSLHADLQTPPLDAEAPPVDTTDQETVLPVTPSGDGLGSPHHLTPAAPVYPSPSGDGQGRGDGQASGDGQGILSDTLLPSLGDGLLPSLIPPPELQLPQGIMQGVPDLPGVSSYDAAVEAMLSPYQPGTVYVPSIDELMTAPPATPMA